MGPDDKCSPAASERFSNHVRAQMFRVNALLMVNAILMGVMVSIGAYGHRYRHHPLTRYIFLGATVLFIPIISYVLSTISNQSIITLFTPGQMIIGMCDPTKHMSYVLIWTGLVQIVGISTTTVVVCDAREGRNIGPSVVLVVQAMWNFYLMVYNIGLEYDTSFFFLRKYLDRGYHSRYIYIGWSLGYVFSLRGLDIFLPFALTFAKLFSKCYAWYKARQSLAIGHNPRFIVGYMEQLQDHPVLASEHPHVPPPLIVMGEETVPMDKQPHGYSFKQMPNRGGLVTLDKVWLLADINLKVTTQFKDVCFSFALSKLLRCRLARYTISETGFNKASNFLWHMLLEDSEDERVLGLIQNELSFLHDWYCSSLPISYSKSWLPILSTLISLSSIGYCLVTSVVISYGWFMCGHGILSMMHCESRCLLIGEETTHTTDSHRKFGNTIFDRVPVVLLLALVVLAEAREITSYICSNWTKVALICRYINHASWQQSPIMQKCISRVLHCTCKFLRHWEDKMNQGSILVFHPRKTLGGLLHRLNPLPSQKVKVPRAVKVAIMNALRSYVGRRYNDDVTSLCTRLQLHVGDKLLWMVNGRKGIANTILVCHIATTILEIRSDPHQPLSNHKSVAIHLSRYCTYLVAYSPELLPDDDEWCKSLYKDVKKDAERVLSYVSSTTQVEYRQLVEVMSATQNHEVLKDGAKLGEQLAELNQGETKTAWEALAGFWSEMILYIAPSDNIDGHVEAIARGGELITLVWALLGHLGIQNRIDYKSGPTGGGV